MLLIASAVGCQGSRWARESPDYARHYPKHSDNPVPIAKQASDARHVADKKGFYAGAAGRDEPVAAGAEIGGFYYPFSTMEGYFGFAGLVDGNNVDHLSGGVKLGGRLQTPTRLAPFVGLSGYLGTVPFSVNDPDQDDDFNGILNRDEDHPPREYVTALAPEVGAHFWLNPWWRITESASRYYTSDDHNGFDMYCVSLGYLMDADQRTYAYEQPNPLALNQKSEPERMFEYSEPVSVVEAPVEAPLAAEAAVSAAVPKSESPYAGLLAPATVAERVEESGETKLVR